MSEANEAGNKLYLHWNISECRGSARIDLALYLPRSKRRAEEKSFFIKKPTVDAVEVVRCKDCKHYLRNKIHVIEGIPLMCNEVCEKWGGGCATDENGFCYMGERREK